MGKVRELRQDIRDLEDQTRMLRSTLLQLESERAGSVNTPTLDEVLRAVADIRDGLARAHTVPEVVPAVRVEDDFFWGGDDAIPPPVLR